MSGSAGGRLAVFVAFAALAAAAAATLAPHRAGPAPSPADLAALEEQMIGAARLHPRVTAPAPAGPAAWCAGCHPGLAHPGTGVAPSLFNEHASRMDCLLCHWPATAGLRPAPGWKAVSGGGSFLAVTPEGRLAPDQLVAMRAAAAAGRRCFPRGPECAVCHRPGGLAGLARPETGRTAALERLENYFTLGPGEKWYFPQIQ